MVRRARRPNRLTIWRTRTLKSRPTALNVTIAGRARPAQAALRHTRKSHRGARCNMARSLVLAHPCLSIAPVFASTGAKDRQRRHWHRRDHRIAALRAAARRCRSGRGKSPQPNRWSRRRTLTGYGRTLASGRGSARRPYRQGRSAAADQTHGCTLERERAMNGATASPSLVKADYLISAQVLYSDAKSRESGGGIGGAFGSAVGLKSKTLESQVLLSLVDVDTGLQESVAIGSARKKDVGVVGGGLLLGLGVGALGGTYGSTEYRQDHLACGPRCLPQAHRRCTSADHTSGRSRLTCTCIGPTQSSLSQPDSADEQ